MLDFSNFRIEFKDENTLRIHPVVGGDRYYIYRNGILIDTIRFVNISPTSASYFVPYSGVGYASNLYTTGGELSNGRYCQVKIFEPMNFLVAMYDFKEDGFYDFWTNQQVYYQLTSTKPSTKVTFPLEKGKFQKIEITQEDLTYLRNNNVFFTSSIPKSYAELMNDVKCMICPEFLDYCIDDRYADYKVVVTNSVVGNRTESNTINITDLYDITLFNSSSEHNRVNKVEYLANRKHYNGTFRDSISITNPVFTIESKDIIHSNYCYIRNFDRFYFIDDIINIRQNVWEIYCSVDTLMSFRNEIQNLDCKVVRQEFNYNNYLIDNKLPATTIPNIERIYSDEEYSDFKKIKNLDLLKTQCIVINTSTSTEMDLRSTGEVIDGDTVYDWMQVLNFEHNGVVISDNSKINLDNIPTASILAPLPIVNCFMKWFKNADFNADFKLLFNNPSESIISMIMYPCDLYEFSNKDNITTIPLYNTKFDFTYGKAGAFPPFNGIDKPYGDNYHNTMREDRKLYCQTFNNKSSVILKGGRINIPNHYNNFLDYSPYTSIQLYIPYYGFINIKPEEVIGKTIELEYDIDIKSGRATCYVNVNNIVFYMLSVDIGYNLEITTTNATEKARNTLMQTIRTVGNVVDLGASMFVPNYSTVKNTKINRNKSNQVTSINTKSTREKTGTTFDANIGGIASFISDTTVGFIQAQVNRIEHGTIDTGFEKLNSENKCYAIIQRVQPIDVPNYNHLVGKPSDYSGKLENLTGYTEVGACHMDGFPNALPFELDDIENQLKTGVIL